MNMPPAEVEADVPETVEEDEVAGPERPARHAAPERELRGREMRQRDPEVGVDEAREAGAVEAGAGRDASVDVADAQVAAGEVHEVRPAGGAGDENAGVGAEDRAGADESAGGGDHDREQRKLNATSHRESPLGRGGTRIAAHRAVVGERSVW